MASPRLAARIDPHEQGVTRSYTDLSLTLSCPDLSARFVGASLARTVDQSKVAHPAESNGM